MRGGEGEDALRWKEESGGVGGEHPSEINFEAEGQTFLRFFTVGSSQASLCLVFFLVKGRNKFQTS